MDRLRAIIVAALAAAFAPGCLTVKVEWPGKAKEKAPAEADAHPGTAPQAKADKKADSGVKQAAAFLPSGPMVSPSVGKLFGKTDSAKAAIHIMSMWRDKVEYLPDPTKNGAMGAGIVGQLFLYGPDMKFVDANGTLTIEMYDETVKAGRAEPIFLGKWTFDKEVLRRLITVDERWGKSYALFLPWPDYKADITRVSLKVRYDQEGGFPIWAPATTVTFNQNVPGLNSQQTSSTVTPLGGPPPSSNFSAKPLNFPAANAPMTPVSGSNFQMPENLPIGGGNTPRSMNAAPPMMPMMPLPAAPMLPQAPGGLPPIVTIAPIPQ